MHRPLLKAHANSSITCVFMRDHVLRSNRDSNRAFILPIKSAVHASNRISIRPVASAVLNNIASTPTESVRRHGLTKAAVYIGDKTVSSHHHG